MVFIIPLLYLIYIGVPIVSFALSIAVASKMARLKTNNFNPKAYMAMTILAILIAVISLFLLANNTVTDRKLRFFVSGVAIVMIIEYAIHSHFVIKKLEGNAELKKLCLANVIFTCLLLGAISLFFALPTFKNKPADINSIMETLKDKSIKFAETGKSGDENLLEEIQTSITGLKDEVYKQKGIDALPRYSDFILDIKKLAHKKFGIVETDEIKRQNYNKLGKKLDDAEFVFRVNDLFKLLKDEKTTTNDANKDYTDLTFFFYYVLKNRQNESKLFDEFNNIILEDNSINTNAFNHIKQRIKNENALANQKIV